MIKLFFLTLFYVPVLFAGTKFRIDLVKVTCSNSCSHQVKELKILEKKEIEIVDIKHHLNKLVDNSLSKASYSIIDEESRIVLSVKIESHKKISKIEVNAKKKLKSDFLSLLKIKVDDYYIPQDVESYVSKGSVHLLNMGYQKVSISFESLLEDDLVILRFKIDADPLPEIKEIDFGLKKDYRKLGIEYFVLPLIGEKYNKLEVSNALSSIEKALTSQGFANVNIVEFEPIISEGKITLRYKLSFDEKRHFNVRGGGRLGGNELQEWLTNEKMFYLSSLSTERLKNEIQKYFLRFGRSNVDLDIRAIVGQTDQNIKFKNYFINIRDVDEIKITSLYFKGSQSEHQKKIAESFYKDGSSLIIGKILDRKYVENFKMKIREYYLRNGHIYVQIQDPLIYMDKKKISAHIQYNIDEGPQVEVGKLNLKMPGINVDVDKLLLSNKMGVHFNPLDLSFDLKKLIKSIRNRGYYFAKYTSTASRDILSYRKNGKVVDINLLFQNLELSRIHSFYVYGNNKTKRWVIERGASISKDELLTVDKILEIRNSLLGLGIFSRVNIETMRVDSISNPEFQYYDLVINVVEKKPGRVEFAPGFRTDIGIKASTSVIYDNWKGEAKTLGLKVQVNQRTDEQFDEERLKDGNKLEYDLKFSYSDPLFLKRHINLSTSISTSRERFYSFDADLIKSSTNISKSFTKYFAAGLGYNLSIIQQSNATNSEDRGYFRIGSLKPSLTFDFRNNRVRPSKGARFYLSWEFASPSFWSQSHDDFEINFDTLIMRSNFYIPLPFGTLAIMVAGGRQENFAVDEVEGEFDVDGRQRTIGYIPSIEVFRLDGRYGVRGFNYDEINRLEDGSSISSKAMQSTAYFFVIKIEPRYFINDQLIIAPFFDAGHLYIDKFKPSTLRTSAGLSFKFVTPVGTIDFDYGVKLKREKDSQISESFGKFQLSVGFF